MLGEVCSLEKIEFRYSDQWEVFFRGERSASVMEGFHLRVWGWLTQEREVQEILIFVQGNKLEVPASQEHGEPINGTCVVTKRCDCPELRPSQE